jgi:hypothetical protein
MLVGALAFLACGGRAAAPPPAKPETPAKQEPTFDGTKGQLAMVMLAEARLPEADAVIRAYGDVAPGAALALDDEKEGTQMYLLGEHLVGVTLVDKPIPDGEADAAAQFSVGQAANRWSPPAHAAHLLVILFPSSNAVGRLEPLRDFTRFVAAATTASGAVGVYWGSGGATHEPGFFVEMVKAEEFPVLVWFGVTSGEESADRTGILSMGMKQLDLPDVLVSVRKAATDANAIAFVYDLLLYVIKFGKALPDGDTVGRADGESLPVHYVDSPIEPGTKVMRVELP